MAFLRREIKGNALSHAGKGDGCVGRHAERLGGKDARENLAAVADTLEHAMRMIAAEGHG